MPLASPNAILAELQEIVHQIIPATHKRTASFAIFDIDGTLLDPFPRQLAIYEEILQPRFHLPPAYLLDLRGKPYFIGDCIPELCENEETYAESTQVFLEHFLSTEFLDRDQPYPGSVYFVEAVRALGLGVIYLTSRHLNGPSTMADKTIEQLGDWGFPIGPSTEVLFAFKNEISDDDLEFKQKFVEKFNGNKFQKCLFVVDNESKMCVMFRQAFPDALVIRFASAQSQDVEYDGAILNTWELD